MKFHFDAFEKDLTREGQTTSCLDFHFESASMEQRDYLMGKIMEALSAQPEEEKTEKEPRIGFHAEDEEE